MKLISVTFLSSYLYCPRKLYLEQVLRIFKIPKEAVVKGNIRHETYEKINNSRESLVIFLKEELSYEEFFNEYKRVYTKILRKVIIKNKKFLDDVNIELSLIFTNTLPLILEEAKIHSRDVYEYSKKSGLIGNELWFNLIPKIESEVSLESEKLGIKGIIDELRIYNNEAVPIELKTGKAPESGVWEGHKIQIGAYMMLLEEKNEFKVKEGVVRYLDYGVDRQVVLNPFLKKEVLDLIEKVKILLSQKTLPSICIHKNKCESCQLYDECNTK